MEPLEYKGLKVRAYTAVVVIGMCAGLVALDKLTGSHFLQAVQAVFGGLFG